MPPRKRVEVEPVESVEPVPAVPFEVVEPVAVVDPDPVPGDDPVVVPPAPPRRVRGHGPDRRRRYRGMS